MLGFLLLALQVATMHVCALAGPSAGQNVLHHPSDRPVPLSQRALASISVEDAVEDLAQLCRTVVMPGCSLRAECGSSTDGACHPITLLANICVKDMPGMKQCARYRAACVAPTPPLPDECTDHPMTPGFPTFDLLSASIKSICQSHRMEECDQCASGAGGGAWTGCNPLNILTSMCRSMPDMLECSKVAELCGKDSAPTPFAKQFPQMCGSGPLATAAPIMRMYFHTGMVDYVLFHEWVPRSTAGYWLTLIAIFLLSVFFELFQTVRSMLESYWSRPHHTTAPTDSTRSSSQSSAGGCCDDKSPLLADAAGSSYSATTASGDMFTSRCPAAFPAGDTDGNTDDQTAWQSLCAQFQAVCKRQPFRVSVEVVRAFMHMTEVTLAYALMLIAMTFNVGMFVAVVLGMGVGWFISARFRQYSTRLCC